MVARRVLAGLAGLLLASCAAVPATPVITLASASEGEPVAVAVPVSDNPAEGMSVNEWGGEVPQPKPSDEVGDDGLGDIG
jgi:hypothetical protein